jgi:diaminohydroxyphosphoribosylaminopyrimidine deaminase / 5-amino-6-(5-phosphoribosylamino)uracil reductase
MERLKKRGVQFVLHDSSQGRVDLKACLKSLGEMGIMTLLVEGGSEVNGSFLDEGLIDKFCLFLSPKWIGDPKAIGIFGGQGVKDLKEAVCLEEVRIGKMGGDFLLEGYVGKGQGLCSQE